MDDLIARIRTAIAEDERIAKAANPSPWRFRIPDAAHLDQNTIFGDGEPHGFDKLRNVCSVEYSWEREANAEHIVRHDPARVLRQAAAHRKILELHAPAILRGGADERYYDTKTVCVSCAPPKGVRPQSEIWPCPTLTALAEACGIQP